MTSNIPHGKKLVEDVIKWLNEKFGKESPLSTT